MCVCVHVCICACVHVCMCMFVHTHTARKGGGQSHNHTHTHIGNPHTDIGRAIKFAFATYGNQALTMTGFRKLLETLDKRNTSGVHVAGSGSGQSLMNWGKFTQGALCALRALCALCALCALYLVCLVCSVCFVCFVRFVYALTHTQTHTNTHKHTQTHTNTHKHTYKTHTGCDHSAGTADKHYIVDDKAEVLRVGLQFSNFYELKNLPINLFLLEGAGPGEGAEEDEAEEELEENEENEDVAPVLTAPVPPCSSS